MLRNALVDREGDVVDGFRHRGKEVSRLEGFSDAAFAFGVTLLVISLEVPKSYEGLLDILRGLPAFAVCFGTLVWLWAAHYRFFRRFGLQDRLTIIINSMLLFVMMVYVYPLKFIFTVFIGKLLGMQPTGMELNSLNQVMGLFVIYGCGFVAVFFLLAMLNIRAYAIRDQLELTPFERLKTREEIARLLGIGMIGALSAALVLLLPERYKGLSGFVYFLVGVVEFLVGTHFGSKANKLSKSSRAVGS